MKRYQLGAHTKHDLKVHLVWVPKYRKRVLMGEVAVRVRDLIRQIAMEHEIAILSGKVASDHIHVLVAYRPHVDVGTIVQWLKGISSRILLQEFPHSRKVFWGRHFWARFRWYWSFFSPGMALIRWVSLGPLKREAECRAHEAAATGAVSIPQGEAELQRPP